MQLVRKASYLSMESDKDNVLLQFDGLEFESNTLRGAKRIANTIVVHAVDHERDEEVGIPISQYNLNYVFQPRDPRDKLFKNILGDPIDPDKLPASVDLRNKWGTIFDQGALGSCVSNTTLGCIRYCMNKDRGENWNPSRLYNYYYGRLLEGFPINEDTGLYIRSGYKSVANYSVCAERNWQYVEKRFNVEPSQYARNAAAQHKTFTYLAIEHDLNQVKKCLADGYPISFGCALYSSFMTAAVARNGIVPYPDVTRERVLGGHAMTIVGYEGEDFIIANSWGKRWGTDGYCKIPQSYILDIKFSGDFFTARVFT